MNLVMDNVPVREAASSPTRASTSAYTPSSSSLSASTSIRKSQVFQRRLKEKISESRALELLDRRIKSESLATSTTESGCVRITDSNQNQDDELVCDSTMVRFDGAAPGPEEGETRASSVLKTVRGIHRQRARDQQPPPSDKKDENQPQSS